VKKHHWISLILALSFGALVAAAERTREILYRQPHTQPVPVWAQNRVARELASAMQRMEWAFYDLRFKLRGARAPHPDVAIVAIRDEDLKAVGQWPWSRAQHVKLIRALEKAPPRALLFDIFFVDPFTADPKGDRDLIAATKTNPWVVHSMFFKLTPQDEVVGLDKPFESLMNAVGAIGYANAAIDEDGVLRRAIPSIAVEGESLPLLSVAGGNLYRGLPWDEQDDSMPLDPRRRLWVNFAGPAWTFPYYAFSDVVSGKVPADTFKDKVVLFGSDSTGAFDHYPTPTSEFMPGLEFHANVLDNVFQRNALRPVEMRWTYAGILFMALFCGLLIARLSAGTGAFWTVALVFAYAAGAQFLFVKRFLALDVAGPLFALAGGYLVVLIYRFFSEEREKRWVKAAFGQYVSPKVLDVLMSDPSKLSMGGERREMSVFFSDVAGFTSISERLNPDELVVLLNRYLSAMTEVVFQYDGYLNKYMGDGIMAFWNAPLKQADHAARSCRCALKSMDRLAQLNEELKAEGITPLKARIGLNSGTMVVGNMGSRQKSDYTVMGDNVNLGSRLEGANKPFGSSIMISEFTYDVIQDEFDVRYLDRIRVPGKAKPVKTYELLAEKGKLSPAWQQALPLYHEGILLFTDRQYAEARRKFLEVSQIVGQDKVCEIYLERAQLFIANPPTKEWDGVFEVKTK
jgi:adenylate cyclase